jgi:hypothetical protein
MIFFNFSDNWNLSYIHPCNPGKREDLVRVILPIDTILPLNWILIQFRLRRQKFICFEHGYLYKEEI